MQFKLPLLAVKDVNRSIEFYKGLFDQEVVLDLGKNKTFSGGFAIQEDFSWITGIPKKDIIEKSNNMELYFEVEDFDEFINKLENHKEIKYVHEPKKYEWQQRVVRIYDPDFHIIEIGESMEIIVKRFASMGYSPSEIAEQVKSPIEFVNMIL